jgi:putative methyltransferase
MNHIYLVQPDAIRLRRNCKIAYLPYAAGQLWAYASAEKAIAEAYCLKRIVFLREAISAVVAAMENPFLVGFSTYIWNTEYCKTLAQAVKEKFSECRILFGGHNISPDGSFLEEFPYIDYLIHGEGEIPLRRLLLELLEGNPNYANVPGLCYRRPDGLPTNNQPETLASLQKVPSPYLTGVFDDILEQYPDISWNTVFETNRGCSNQCAYCDWGTIAGKIRCFSNERVLGEIAWFGAKRIEYVLFADANFGAIHRDETYVDVLIEQYKTIGYPLKLEIIYAKGMHERVQRMVQKLHGAQLSFAGARLSLQSLSPVVQKNINRSNLDLTQYERILRSYRKAGLPVICELILGLPGETLQSFCEGIGKLLEMGLHNGIYVFQLVLLPNSRLALPKLRHEFAIETVRCTHQILSKSLVGDAYEDIMEYEDAVVSTAGMPQEHMLSAFLFSALVVGLHSSSLIWYIPMYLHAAIGLPYETFYRALLEFACAHPETLLSGAVERLKRNRLDKLKGMRGSTLALPYGEKKNVNENAFLFGSCVYELNRFFRETTPFFSAFFQDKTLFEDLLRFQLESVRQPNVLQKICDFRYDFPAYFQALQERCPSPLQKHSVRLVFTDMRNPKDWDAFWLEVNFEGSRENRTLNAVSYVEEFQK